MREGNGGLRGASGLQVVPSEAFIEVSLSFLPGPYGSLALIEVGPNLSEERGESFQYSAVKTAFPSFFVLNDSEDFAEPVVVFCKASKSDNAFIVPGYPGPAVVSLKDRVYRNLDGSQMEDVFRFLSFCPRKDEKRNLFKRFR